MSVERTLCIIKPDSLEKRVQGAILQQLLDEGFEVLAMRQLVMTQAMAEAFYEVHRERPFYADLVKFMTRGPVIVIALRRENAVEQYRKVIGATDPSRAEPGTIRHKYGSSVGENAVHGSDSVDNGIRETNFFFPEHLLV